MSYIDQLVLNRPRHPVQGGTRLRARLVLTNSDRQPLQLPKLALRHRLARCLASAWRSEAKVRYRARWFWPIVLVASGAFVVGCGGNGGSNGGTAGEATKLLARAKATVDAASSAHFTITSAHVPSGGAALLGGEGIAARPGKFKGALQVSLAGNRATVEVISTDGKVYAKLPFAAGFAITDPAQFGFADPGKFMDPATGVSNLLVKATRAKLTKKSRIGSDVVQQVTASIPGSIVQDLLTSADPSKPVAATFSIVEKSGQLRRAVVTGPFFQKGVSSTFTIDLDRYGEKVEIRAPSTS
jgi:hypothetical protein